ncbi:MAG: hydroxymethylglutaryl-CoA reductase [Bacteriovoracales bacterium]|nr:hydroxymethylglutaryl-CoA reductase [Bacteriovoracales bacterium]
MDSVKGFSKLSKEEKLAWLSRSLGDGSGTVPSLLSSFWHPDENRQKAFEDFSENTLSNFFLPFGLAPNFLINGKTYAVPMVIEESSVVAAASKAAKFWLERGGFKARVLKSTKVGQVHFLWQGSMDRLLAFFERVRSSLLEELKPLTKRMERRGGGITGLRLLDKTQELPGYGQLFVEFETCDAMGANFINSVLESLGRRFAEKVRACEGFSSKERQIEIIMGILSNYTPDCLVSVKVDCPVSDLGAPKSETSGEELAKRIKAAVDIARVDPHRAVTHNKGIFNGVDAVVMATGNDFRAVEACGHAHAALGTGEDQDQEGEGMRYRGLTRCVVEGGHFTLSLDLPLSLGTVGGLTSLHPLAELSLEILGRPGAKELMMIAASVGLAQNFAALKSLVTTGIQRGHMKMHLLNILNMLEADDFEKERVKAHFVDRVVTFSEVRRSLKALRECQ